MNNQQLVMRQWKIKTLGTIDIALNVHEALESSNLVQTLPALCRANEITGSQYRTIGHGSVQSVGWSTHGTGLIFKRLDLVWILSLFKFF